MRGVHVCATRGHRTALIKPVRAIVNSRALGAEWARKSARNLSIRSSTGAIFIGLGKGFAPSFHACLDAVRPFRSAWGISESVPVLLYRPEISRLYGLVEGPCVMCLAVTSVYTCRPQPLEGNKRLQAPLSAAATIIGGTHAIQPRSNPDHARRQSAENS